MKHQEPQGRYCSDRSGLIVDRVSQVLLTTATFRSLEVIDRWRALLTIIELQSPAGRTR